MPKICVFLVTIFSNLLFISLLNAQWWKSYPYHKEGTLIYFPQDEGIHSEYSPGLGTEWWYVNMHLQGETTQHNYSAMAAFLNYRFRIFNITDETDHEFQSFLDIGSLNVSQDYLDLTFTPLLKNPERWFIKTDSLGQVLPFQYHLHVGDDNNNLNLDLDAQKPPLIIGMDGLVTVGTGDSYYYSLTHLDVTGSLTFEGVTESVTGLAWIDHQYGPFFLSPGGKESYEWFSLQLDNGMDINLWNIFTGDDKIPQDDSHRICTIYIDDQTQDTSSTFHLQRPAFWEYSEQKYFANKWHFYDPIHKIDLTITPLFNDQVVPFIEAFFWEGSCSVSGTVNGDSVKGHAFAELLHIYEPPLITVLSPNGGELWDGSKPIIWTLENPDDGNPLTYDIYYKIWQDNQFTPIVTGIADTSCFWDISGFTQTDSCLVKVIGYSVDSTISGTDCSDGTFSIVSPSKVFDRITLKPSSYKLFQNYPNPFNDQTRIQFTTGKSTEIRLEIYDVHGKLVKVLLNGMCRKGTNSITWDGTDSVDKAVSSGIYLYRLNAGQYVEANTLLLLK